MAERLPRLIGPARASARSLPGDHLPADKAADWGLIWVLIWALIWACVEDAALMSTAHAMARRLSRLPAYAAPAMRALLAASAVNDFNSQYDHELAGNEHLLDGAAFREGLTAFVDKREPDDRPIAGRFP